MKDNKNKRIDIRISEEEKVIIMNYCKANNLSVSELFREAIKEKMQGGNKWKN